MVAEANKIVLAEKFAQFEDHWSPKIVAEIDDYDVKLVKLRGEFVWHKHDDADEMFLVIEGALNIDFRDRQVVLAAGEMIVIPKGVEHRPHAEDECRVLLLERKGIVNTGDAMESEFTNPAVRI